MQLSDFKAKCPEIDFGWDSAPGPAVGAFGDPPDPIAGFMGASSKCGPRDFAPPPVKN